MEAFINCFFLIFVSEIGDKTQLLAIVLATRFQRPWLILSGVFVATVLNHGLASWLGAALATLASPATLKWLLAFTFFAFAAWILVPDKEDENQKLGTFGVFATTVIAFFMAEMGDKTQLATVALGARYHAPLIVTFGTTAGMLASNAMALFWGPQLLKKIPMNWIRRLACGLFVIFGFMILFGL